ncbi:hypothetical protein M231_07390 [Tremella mesenterica]|uniref:Nucleoporin Nup54 alpha-helical domain-containing protein n=1 Tax=Tremella mesenterica TaxID=5217 RepID=A0A4Q1B9B6_TREME|nr:uncharacterized protein TREMEDRAFT_60183 [Tremella mesenterica DSM 1558]EIW71250.1 hypothetical protein TREMEDRAFT_60183 [Tremella mesenterica DSM 1558]RXK35368.1 hypothetical protein M231_07390 [Tremella mesenterica]
MSFSFGNTQNQNQNQPQAFGSGSTSAPNTIKPFSFTTPNPQSSASPFGVKIDNPAPASSFSFGTSQNQNQTQNQQSNTGFGSTQNQSTGGFNFGTNNQNAQPQQGIFGSNTAQQGQQNNTFGFKPLGNLGASQNQGNTFGSQNQAQQGGFGSINQPSQQHGGFGSSQPFQSQQQQQQPQQQQPQPQNGFGTAGNALGQSIIGPRQELGIEERMLAVQRAWDVTSPDCRFQYFFYNVVDPGTAPQYGRPAGATDDQKWARAMRDNPDPQNMVPVLATGWADVKKRVQMQEQVASVHQQKLKEISAALANLTRQASLSSSIRLQTLQTSLKSLQSRLIHLAAQSPQFIPALHSTPFRPEETIIRSTLENVQAELDGRSTLSSVPGTPGTPRSVGLRSEALGGKKGKRRMIGEVNELWGLLDEVRRQRKLRQIGGGAEWTKDEKSLAQLAEVLGAQQTALAKLSGLVGDALFDADVIKGGLERVRNDERMA